MIEFRDLPAAIEGSGPEGKMLVELSKTPFSRTLVGILVKRVEWIVLENHEADYFHLFVCEDRSGYEVRLRERFSVLCLDPAKLSEPQAALGQLRDQLRALDLHR